MNSSMAIVSIGCFNLFDSLIPFSFILHLCDNRKTELVTVQVMHIN